MNRPAEPIRSRSNPLLQRLRRLKREASRGEELALIEGVRLLEEAVAAGVEVIEIAATAQALDSSRTRAAVEVAERRGSDLRLVEEAPLASLSEVETSQGVLAIARRPAFDEDRLFAGTPLIVVAVGLQNPGNLGGVLRSAEAAGATGAYLTRGSADPFSWKALRGSMGSAFRLPLIAGLPPAVVLDRLKARGVRTAATVVEGGRCYDTADLRGPVALLLGNEGAGLPDDLAGWADLRLAIPMAGGVESLNVGAAAAILLFEAARQRRGDRT